LGLFGKKPRLIFKAASVLSLGIGKRGRRQGSHWLCFAIWELLIKMQNREKLALFRKNSIAAPGANPAPPGESNHPAHFGCGYAALRLLR
jgi:hypothetical protein